MQLVLEFLALPFVQDVLKILFILLLFAIPPLPGHLHLARALSVVAFLRPCMFSSLQC